MRIAVFINTYTTRGREGPDTHRSIIGAKVQPPSMSDGEFDVFIARYQQVLRNQRTNGFGMEMPTYEGDIDVEMTTDF